MRLGSASRLTCGALPESAAWEGLVIARTEPALRRSADHVGTKRLAPPARIIPVVDRAATIVAPGADAAAPQREPGRPGTPPGRPSCGGVAEHQHRRPGPADHRRESRGRAARSPARTTAAWPARGSPGAASPGWRPSSRSGSPASACTSRAARPAFAAASTCGTVRAAAREPRSVSTDCRGDEAPRPPIVRVHPALDDRDPVAALVRQHEPAVDRRRDVVRDGPRWRWRAAASRPGRDRRPARPGRRDQAGHDRRRRGPEAPAVRDGVVPAQPKPGHRPPRSASPTSAERMIRCVSSRGIASAPSPDTSIWKPARARSGRPAPASRGRARSSRSPDRGWRWSPDTSTATVRPTSTARAQTRVSRPDRRPTAIARQSAGTTSACTGPGLDERGVDVLQPVAGHGDHDLLPAIDLTAVGLGEQSGHPGRRGRFDEDALPGGQERLRGEDLVDR